MRFFARLLRSLPPAARSGRRKSNHRAHVGEHAILLLALFLLESCLTPEPRFYQTDRRDREAATDSLRLAQPSSAIHERTQSNENPETIPQATPDPPALKAAAAPVPPPAPGGQASRQGGRVPQSNDPALKMVQAGGRTYGSYRLKAGEALYSAVVVRFTGRVEAEDVNQIARQLLALNNISDETQIPTGAEIRIPLELIDDAFFAAQVPPQRISPRRGYFQHVILDAGHGGTDPGTIVRGLREDEIAFDLTKRIQAGLVKRGVKVHALVSTHHNASKMTNGHVMREGKRQQYVKVTPAYNMRDSRIGLNLRIYLIDDIYNRLQREGVAPEDVLFLSVHLDHLHPSVGGTMAYIPDAEERVTTFRATGEVYDNFIESRGQTISFDSHRSRLSENASAGFAQTLITSFRRDGLPVHAYKPIRGYVYRGGGKWTPGIIRYSRVPASVLIEASNLAHRADWQRIRSANFRQRWADAVVRAIVSLY
jgi:N-acetylmuramoyl-L-alanine amidase